MSDSRLRTLVEDLDFEALVVPVLLLAAASLALSFEPAHPLVAVAAVGWVISARYRAQGIFWALGLLAVYGIIRHGYLSENHLWDAGLEVSCACAFYAASLGFGHRARHLDALKGQIAASTETHRHLEEEARLAREEALQEKLSLQEKMGALQKECEEAHSELSTLSVLNEVLRKQAASHIAEKERLVEELTEREREIAGLRAENEGLGTQLARIESQEPLVEENRLLLKELNAARVDKAQTQQVNETLAQWHAKEAKAAQEALERLNRLHADYKEMQEKWSRAQSEVDLLSSHVEQVAGRLQEAENLKRSFEALSQEKAFLQERMERLEAELQGKTQRIEQLLSSPPDPAPPTAELESLLQQKEELSERLRYAEEKIQTLAHTSSLYDQLRKQFSEKNQVLADTRAELFHTQTKLGALEKELTEQNALFPSEIVRDLTLQEEEIAALSQENQALIEIVSTLSELKKK
jgi:chromosome segregation ATPase